MKPMTAGPEFDTTRFESTAADFDFLEGTFEVSNRRLEKRLAGCREWVEFGARLEGHRKLLGGLANLDRFRAELDGAPFEGVSLRVFDPAAGLWTIYWMDTLAPRLTEQVVGGFHEGIGEFRGTELFQGHPVPLRFLWTGITPTGARWEQAWFDLERQAWETNWIMQFTRIAAAR